MRSNWDEFVQQSGVGTIASTIGLNATGTVIRIVPTAVLRANKQYCYYVQGGVQGSNGLAAQQLGICFTTGAGPQTVAPTVEEAKSAGAHVEPKSPVSTPACDKMKQVGQWNTAWDPFLDLDPAWTDEFMATAIGIYASGVLPAKDVELLSIAFDASYTHMYAPGTRRHILNALKAGATVEDIMEVLKLCVVQGVQACNLGVPILAEELSRGSDRTKSEPGRGRQECLSIS